MAELRKDIRSIMFSFRQKISLLLVMFVAACTSNAEFSSDKHREDSISASSRVQFLADELSKKVSRCWVLPAGLEGMENLQVTMKIRIDPEGNLSAPPIVLKAGDTESEDSAAYRIFVESASSAVQRCGPFPELAEYIRDIGEEEIIFKFNAREYLDG